MDRESVDSLTEQIRVLQEGSARLEADLERRRRITGPQRVLRAVTACAVVALGGAVSATLGYGCAIREAQEAAQAAYARHMEELQWQVDYEQERARRCEASGKVQPFEP